MWIGRLLFGPVKEHQEDAEYKRYLQRRREDSVEIRKLAKEVQEMVKKRRNR